MDEETGEIDEYTIEPNQEARTVSDGEGRERTLPTYPYYVHWTAHQDLDREYKDGQLRAFWPTGRYHYDIQITVGCPPTEVKPFEENDGEKTTT
jgi:hypothetical protein